VVIVEDSSGYNHNGTIVGSPIPGAQTARYSSSTYISTSEKQYIATPNILFENIL